MSAGRIGKLRKIESLDFCGMAILDDMALYRAMVRLQVTAYIWVFAGSDMELAFVCMGKSLLVWSLLEYFPIVALWLEILSE